MAAPYVISAEIISIDTVNILFNETLEPVSAENIGHYTIENIVTSGLITILDASLDDSYSGDNSLVILTTYPHETGNYIMTASGIFNSTREEIDYNQNTANYSYTTSGLSLTILEPTGGEVYLNGQLKTISWNLIIT